jgi:hypothetical protein
MGAALTYARRYALFTLVGIAGEDDLDATDLPTQSAVAASHAPAPQTASNPSWHRKNAKAAAVLESKTLSPQDSAKQRDQLLVELPSLGSEDEAAQWAKRILAIKNSLTTADAGAIEAAFADHMARFSERMPVHRTDIASDDQAGRQSPPTETADADEWALLGRTRRRRDKAHLKFVASQPCLLCNRRPADAHHLRHAQPMAMGRKVSDEFTVPLCRTHHRQVHRTGDEAEWWSSMDHDIDPLEIAKGLWEQSHHGRPVQPMRPRVSEGIQPQKMSPVSGVRPTTRGEPA